MHVQVLEFVEPAQNCIELFFGKKIENDLDLTTIHLKRTVNTTTANGNKLRTI